MSRRYSNVGFSRYSSKKKKSRLLSLLKFIIFISLFSAILLLLSKDVEPERGKVSLDITNKVKSGDFK